MNIQEMIRKYSIKVIGENIAVSVPKHGKRNMEQLNWIKEHKSEIISFINAQEAEKEAIKAEEDRIFAELRKSNPEMRRGNYLTERAIASVMEGNSVDATISAYRSLYVDVMDAKANY